MNEPNKQYVLTLEQRPEYVYARVEADIITEEIAMGYLHEVTDRCRSIECDRLLVDRDIPAMLPDGALFFVAAEFQKMVQGIKVAFVNKYISNDDSLDFAVRVGMNRGADYGVFSNVDDAERWLLGG